MEYTLKKSLGQHFLISQLVIGDIVDAIGQSITTADTSRLVEVGPGGGAITGALHQLPGVDFRAIELDSEKVAYLHKTYPALTGKIIEQDVLKAEPPFGEPFVLCGNFPYNISSQILFRLLDWKALVPEVVGMFQKEVAQRVAAKPGSKAFGVITVLIQAFYEVHYLFDVPPEAFNPPPKVMSGVIRLVRKQEPLHMASYKKLETLVKTAFNQRRKMLRNGLKPLFPAEFLQDALFSKRAEQMSIEDFGRLTFQMN